MCTVSYVRTESKVIITSNRDEMLIRLNPLAPKKHNINGKIIIYPEDTKGGGTWYVVDETGTVLVLLNGADEKHIAKLSYRKSRGLIVLEIIGNDSPVEYWDNINLDDIEPFTLVLYQEQLLYQLRWNGESKEKLSLDPDKEYIWSSVSLYSAAIREARSALFHDFINKTAVISEDELYLFHSHRENNNPESGLVIDREGELKTLSITQTVIEENKVSIRHYDLINTKDYKTSFVIG
jgi:uncharacterized protein with NRDE domain